MTCAPEGIERMHLAPEITMNVAIPQNAKFLSNNTLCARPVPEILLELAYQLHATKAIAARPSAGKARPAAADWRPRKSR
jgi:hypothetical protein